MQLTEWKFSQNTSNGEKVDIEDTEWEIKKSPLYWSLKDGEAFFRKWIEIPEEIEGIEVKGSRIELSFIFPSGVTLFVNGEKVYSHKFWGDKVATLFLPKEKAIPGEKILIVFKTPSGDGFGTFWAELNIENILFQLNSLPDKIC